LTIYNGRLRCPPLRSWKSCWCFPAWSRNIARNFITKFPFTDAAGLAGRKIRSLPSPVVTETVRLMGAAATPMAFGEVYTGLQAGVIDGLEHDAPTIISAKFYETAKFFTLTRHILHTAESMFHDHKPANDYGLKSCWIYRRHDQQGFGATMNPGQMPHVDFRFTSMHELVKKHQEQLRVK
jgi:hypothetical protein